MNRTPFFSVESDTLGTLRVSGAISYSNAGSALARMPQPGRAGGTMDIDLSALEKSDSATLAVLIAWAARASRQGVTLRYKRVPQGLRNLAKLVVGRSDARDELTVLAAETARPLVIPAHAGIQLLTLIVIPARKRGIHAPLLSWCF